ncbi:4,5-dihydroxyphthalate decarboxylase [Actinocorallia herbida]|uniref:4,5-dihydroxyphthalate decarboxylase n=1 Tax=Actinocorallia herbida TaxID=58109 RepID=A0A3N1D276_9ACTN|nr:4,5-dihydroxyphthalate decarboxylase [Actinocorallia herbida]ROO87612.1 4,5-dihydroxyphthalate decarboxylase [Actinocorallia herbida]
MTALERLAVGVGDYDHTRDLWTGGVTSGALELDVTVAGSPEEVFSRFLEGGEWDAAEMSFAVAAALRGQGDDSLVVLPVFPARAFRHGAIYVRSDGPVGEPADLAGRRVGIPAWAQTAGVYVRGLLASEFGVDPRSIEWIQAGVDEPGRKEPVEIGFEGFRIRSEPEATLDRLLLDGEVDAVISARPPASVERRDRRVRRLFKKHTFDEMEYAKRSGIFPIMHVLVVRREFHDAHPGFSFELERMFTEAKDRSIRRALSAVVPSYPLPWAAANAARARDLIGEDFWPYGVEPNRPTIELFLDHCADQSITPRRLDVDELFLRAPSTASL